MVFHRRYPLISAAAAVTITPTARQRRMSTIWGLSCEQLHCMIRRTKFFNFIKNTTHTNTHQHTREHKQRHQPSTSVVLVATRTLTNMGAPTRWPIPRPLDGIIRCCVSSRWVRRRGGMIVDLPTVATVRGSYRSVVQLLNRWVFLCDVMPASTTILCRVLPRPTKCSHDRVGAG